MVADLLRALLAGAAGAVLPGYFWAVVLRPTSGLGERLAWSTAVSMATVPTVAVIIARAAHTGVALWVALASVLIVFGSGLLVFRLRGAAPGSAAPVLRMPEPTRDPRVLGLVAAAIALGLLMMADHRPPVLVLGLIAVALLAGGALMAWPRPTAPEDSPSERAAGFLAAPPPAPGRPPRRRPPRHRNRGGRFRGRAPGIRARSPAGRPARQRPARQRRTRWPVPRPRRTRGRSACRCRWCGTAASR